MPKLHDCTCTWSNSLAAINTWANNVYRIHWFESENPSRRCHHCLVLRPKCIHVHYVPYNVTACGHYEPKQFDAKRVFFFLEKRQCHKVITLTWPWEACRHWPWTVWLSSAWQSPWQPDTLPGWSARVACCLATALDESGMMTLTRWMWSYWIRTRP